MRKKSEDDEAPLPRWKKEKISFRSSETKLLLGNARLASSFTIRMLMMACWISQTRTFSTSPIPNRGKGNKQMKGFLGDHSRPGQISSPAGGALVEA